MLDIGVDCALQLKCVVTSFDFGCDEDVECEVACIRCCRRTEVDWFGVHPYSDICSWLVAGTRDRECRVSVDRVVRFDNCGLVDDSEFRSIGVPDCDRSYAI